MLSRSLRLHQLGMLFLSERDQLTVAMTRLRTGFQTRESLQKAEEHLKEIQRLVEEAKHHEGQPNLCCYRD